jgi:hypothetical protein
MWLVDKPFPFPALIVRKWLHIYLYCGKPHYACIMVKSPLCPQSNNHCTQVAVTIILRWPPITGGSVLAIRGSAGDCPLPPAMWWWRGGGAVSAPVAALTLYSASSQTSSSTCGNFLSFLFCPLYYLFFHLFFFPRWMYFFLLRRLFLLLFDDSSFPPQFSSFVVKPSQS